MKFEELSSKPDFSEIQPSIIEFWKENKTFEKSVDLRKEWEIVFYDGPPFPTGKPHHGTVLVSFIKDMISRYWTMRGYSVPRAWGWDCHGLPIENLIEIELGINSKHEIEAMGIDKFNEACRASVLRYTKEWRQTITRMGRWVDFDNDYM